MKKIAVTIIFLLIAGCSAHGAKEVAVPQKSIKYILDDGVTEIDLPYYGMPKEIAQKLLDSASAQREKYSDYWKAAFNKDASPSLTYDCTKLECTYRVSISIPCDGIKYIALSPMGSYPDLTFNYVRHTQAFHECCFPARKKKWWQWFSS